MSLEVSSQRKKKKTGFLTVCKQAKLWPTSALNKEMFYTVALESQQRGC